LIGHWEGIINVTAGDVYLSNPRDETPVTQMIDDKDLFEEELQISLPMINSGLRHWASVRATLSRMGFPI